MSDPDARPPDAAPGTDVSRTAATWLAWAGEVRDEAYANQMGAAIDGAPEGLDWADVITRATDITVHGGHPQELTEQMRAWARRGGRGHGRPARLLHERPRAVARPAWCGEDPEQADPCDPATRLTLTDPPARCPACHPLTQRQESA